MHILLLYRHKSSMCQWQCMQCVSQLVLLSMTMYPVWFPTCLVVNDNVRSVIPNLSCCQWQCTQCHSQLVLLFPVNRVINTSQVTQLLVLFWWKSCEDLQSTPPFPDYPWCLIYSLFYFSGRVVNTFKNMEFYLPNSPFFLDSPQSLLILQNNY